MQFHTQWPLLMDLSPNDPLFYKKIVTDSTLIRCVGRRIPVSFIYECPPPPANLHTWISLLLNKTDHGGWQSVLYALSKVQISHGLLFHLISKIMSKWYIRSDSLEKGYKFNIFRSRIISELPFNKADTVYSFICCFFVFNTSLDGFRCSRRFHDT